MLQLLTFSHGHESLSKFPCYEPVIPRRHSQPCHTQLYRKTGNSTRCFKYQLCFTLLGDLEQVISNPPGLHSLAIKRVHVYKVKPYGLWSWRPRWQTALPPTSHMIIGEVTQHPCASVPQPLLPNRGHKTARATGWLWTGGR